MSQPTFSYGTPSYTTSFGAKEPTAAAPQAGGGADLIKDTTTQTFKADVLDVSRTTPVMVDFWAEWCGPCKQLTPVIEKAVKNAKGKVRLVKMDIDKYPEIAGQLGIKSIPAVIAFKNGQAIDGFMGALPESQVNQFIERLVGPLGPSDVDAILAEADVALANNEIDAAIDLFAAAMETDPSDARGAAGMARAAVVAGEIEQAKAVLSTIPADKQKDPAVAAARAQIELAEQSAALGDSAELQARIAADPNDHQARIDLAVWLVAKGDREAAVDHLIESVRRKRDWNEEAARKQLVQFFEAWGPKDEMTLYGRRRLSSVLFA
jgi:putative thioredoxin